jgi:hypothetical protein
MRHPSPAPKSTLRLLFLAWLGLMLLTGVSILIGHELHGKAGLQPLVAGVLWLKSWLVVRYFLEGRSIHWFFRRVLYVFIAITPLCLVGLGLWHEGAQFRLPL